MAVTQSGSNLLLVSFAKRHPDDFALSIMKGDVQTQESLLSALPDETMASVVAYLPPDVIQSFLRRRDEATIARWMAQLDLDSAVKLARQIGEVRLNQLGKAIPEARLSRLINSCRYPELSVGAYVTSAFSWVREDQTILDAIVKLRSQRMQSDAPLLVLDDSTHVLGWFDTDKALLADSTDFVRGCVAPVQPVLATSDVRATLLEFRAQREAWLPVIDVDAHPVGLLHQSKLPMVSWQASIGGHDLFVPIIDAMLALLAGLTRSAIERRP